MRIADASRTMAEMRARMEEDEQLSVLMAGLRGANMNASDFADKDVVMQVDAMFSLLRPACPTPDLACISVHMCTMCLRESVCACSNFRNLFLHAQLISVEDTDGEVLPLTYDPELIADYWMRRPVSIVGRVLQLMGAAPQSWRTAWMPACPPACRCCSHVVAGLANRVQSVMPHVDPLQQSAQPAQC